MASAASISVFSIAPTKIVLGTLIIGAWINPLAYVFRAFGINAFAWGGSAI